MFKRFLLDKETEGGNGKSTAEVTPEVTPEVIPTETAETPAEVTQVVETETPTEPVDFSDFLNAKEGIEKEIKPEEKKTEKSTEEVKAPEEKKEVTPTATEKKGKVTRDYTGLPQEVIPAFQRMSNEAFDTLRPFYIDAIATKAKLAEVEAKLAEKPADVNTLPESYYEHPSGFVLSPEYNKAASAAQEADLVLNHWTEQLDSVREGATQFVPLVRDQKTGQIALGAPQPVDGKTRSYLERLFFNSNSQASRFRDNLSQVQNTFATKHSQALADLKAYETETFKVFEDPKNPLLPAVKDTLAKMHPTFRANPLAPMLAKALVTATFLGNKVAEFQAQLKNGGVTTAKKKIDAAQAAAGPTATGAAQIEKTEPEVTMDDFEKVKQS